jgi:hypothetical protein
MDLLVQPLSLFQPRSLKEIAARNPASVLTPTVDDLPMFTASGLMAAAIIVGMAPAASPSAMSTIL